MNIKCILGLHRWDGCKCSSCGKVRDIEHDWGQDCKKCSRCGKTRDIDHNWSEDCEACSKCNTKRTNYHDWSQDCTKCSQCSKVRDKEHDWSQDCEKCVVCGKSRDGFHDWDGCLCNKCNAIRNEGHEISSDGSKCLKCGSEPFKYGQTGPGGGIIIQVDDSGFHGLEVKTSDDGEADWPKSHSRVTSHGNGWRLPSVQELLRVYNNKDMIGGFKDSWYWSATEHQPGFTWYAVVFTNGNSMPLRKHGDACYIRAVREF